MITVNALLASLTNPDHSLGQDATLLIPTNDLGPRKGLSCNILISSKIGKLHLQLHICLRAKNQNSTFLTFFFFYIQTSTIGEIFTYPMTLACQLEALDMHFSS